MGMIQRAMDMVFGSGRNVIAETAEVFRVNAEAQARRDADARSEALAQFGDEFLAGERSRFDAVMDGLNRVPRPAMALGTLGLFGAAMVDPDWFAARMAGLALVPEPLWWLLAAVVSFYFGARHQAKGQDFQRQLALAFAASAGRPGRTASPEAAPPPPLDAPRGAPQPGAGAGNAALAEWRRRRDSE
ncbi:holin family protein [Roseivivax sp. CAU 1761]